VKKLAIFVEGQTEQIFLKSFIEEIAGSRNIEFDCKVLNAGTLLTLNQKPALELSESPNYFVLLVNCQNDEKVKSVVLEQRDSLTKKGYSLILGLRDLFPKPYTELTEVKEKLKYRLPTSGVPTHILLAVTEIEAWFIQEHSHFKKIHRNLDPLKFKDLFGFDPINECVESIEHPSQLLHSIYSSVGLAYKKNKSQVTRTVKVLDFANMYLQSTTLVPHLAELVGHIECYLTP
jgi:hypothetical protein